MGFVGDAVEGGQFPVQTSLLFLGSELVALAI